MNASEQLIFIANNILPLEAKHDCHIFVRYSPHVECIEVQVHPLKWVPYANNPVKYFETLESYSDLPEVESYIIETKANAKSIAQKRLEEIEKEKEALLKQMGEK